MRCSGNSWLCTYSLLTSPFTESALVSTDLRCTLAVPTVGDSAMYTAIGYLLLAGFAVDAAQEQVPQPQLAYEPVKYPDDYCENISPNEQFDYIVVGAGPGGSSVARRLAEDPSATVLLMEAGDNPAMGQDIPTGRSIRPDQLWDLRSEPSYRQCAGFPQNGCKYILGKFLGGSSEVNLMMYARGIPQDYADWENTPGCEGWGWNQNFPYYLKLENFRDPFNVAKPDPGYHNVGGPFTTAPSNVDPQSNEFRTAFESSLLKLGVPFNPDPNGRNRVGLGAVTGLLNEMNYRNNVARAYLLNLPSNMKVCKRSVVSRVLMSPDKTVYGVEYMYNGEKQRRTIGVRREAVIAGGPVNTPQVLERSGLGNRDILSRVGVPLVQHMPGVGENLQEQFTNLGCAFQIDFQTDIERNPLSIALTSISLFVNMRNFMHPVPDIQWLFVPYSPSFMKFKDNIANQYKAAMNSSFVLMAGSVVLRQSNRGYVHIKSTDPTKNPAYNPMQFTSEEETFLTTESCRLMRTAMQDPGVVKFNPRPIVLDECKQYAFNSPEEIMCQARLVAYPSYHMAGGTTMGAPNDPMAVVDNRLRVLGVRGLRISDLSAMPSVVRGNTEVPTLALGERAAAIIREDAQNNGGQSAGYGGSGGTGGSGLSGTPNGGRVGLVGAGVTNAGGQFIGLSSSSGVSRNSIVTTYTTSTSSNSGYSYVTG